MGQRLTPCCTPDRIFPVVYQELRKVAAAYMRQERPDHTLQPTALVHEAYLRLARNHSMVWNDRFHVLAMAAIEMRRILVDHARRKQAQRRGGGWSRVSLGGVAAKGTADLLDLEDAMRRLHDVSPRQCTVATLRVFGDLPEREIGAFLGVSERTVRDEWRVARAWLRRQLAT